MEEMKVAEWGQPPKTLFNKSICKHLFLFNFQPKILPALVNALIESRGAANENDILEHCEAVILAVSDDSAETGIGCIMEELLSACNKGKDIRVQRSAVTLLHSFCRDTK